jgi:hypothetical protein
VLGVANVDSDLFFVISLNSKNKEALLSESIGHFNAKLCWPFNQFCFCSD